jgi:hypothetical protein
MKIFFSEYLSDYTTYTFSYAVYCLKESQSELPEIYSRGFLPYTGNISLEQDIFYLARSLRVDLSRFSDTSENRRINRKASELNIRIEAGRKEEFDTASPEFRAFCTEYAESRFVGGVMNEDRLEYVLTRSTLTHILTYRSDTKIYGYVFAALEREAFQYWYAFFDTDYLSSHSLGKWMMWSAIHWAKQNGAKYAYLGTCYKEKALYKVRDHEGVEFFDGEGWNPDKELLKHLCRTDESPKDRDLFKQQWTLS